MGGKLLVAPFPAYGEISFVGSLASPVRAMKNRKIADVHAAMLLEGTQKHDKQAIQALLDDWGASLSFYVMKERLYFSGRVSTRNAQKLFSLIKEALVMPTFPARELVHLKSRFDSEFALEAQDTRSQAGINLSRILYNAEHPNYRESTHESLEDMHAVTPAELKSYQTQAIDVASLVLAISGEISALDALFLAEKSFKGVPRQIIERVGFAVAERSQPQTTRVEIKDKASVDCMYGIATGITKDHPDYPALMLGIQILGNAAGFTGRLMRIVREIEGLTYGTYAYMSGFANADGFISVWGTFAPQLFDKGRTALMREIKSIVESGVTTEEIKNHRAMYEARSRVLIADSSAFARVAHDTAIEGRKMSYLDEFPKYILTLTKAQVDKALKKYLVPQNMSESSAGPIENSTAYKS